MRKPFWRSSHKCWYFKNEFGNFVRLDPDESKAIKEWHRILSELKSSGPDATVTGIFNAFFEEHQHEWTGQARAIC